MARHYHVGGQRGWVYAFKEDANRERQGRSVTACDRGMESACGTWAALERMFAYDPDWPKPRLVNHAPPKRKRKKVKRRPQ